MNVNFDRRRSGNKLVESISNSPSSHVKKNRHRLSSHYHISDPWRYLVHTCELLHYSLDLL